FERRYLSIVLSRMGSTTSGAMSHRGATTDRVPAHRNVANNPSRSPNPAKCERPLEQAAENTTLGADTNVWHSCHPNRCWRPLVVLATTLSAKGRTPL